MATNPKSTASTAASAKTAAAQSPAKDVEAEIALLREDIARLAKEISQIGGRSVNTAKRAASQGVEQLKARGEAKYEDLRGSAEDIEAEVSRRVREKPLTSLAMAAGVGFLFALIARR